MRIVSVDEMRRLERLAVDSGTPEYRLMRRAGAGAAAAIEKFARGRFRRAVFFCGAGNNAGDAFVAAALLGMPHILLPFRPPETLKGCAARAFGEFEARLNICGAPEEFDFEPGDLIVDALLGTGFSGAAVRAPLDSALKIMGDSRLPAVALDLPSGLSGDTGEPAPGTLRAALTITFGFPKRGMFFGRGPELCGKIEVVPIGLDGEGADSGREFELFTRYDAAALLPEPAFDAHKNSRGRVVVLCGSTTYPGAAALAAAGALRFAGLVRLLTVRTPAPPVLPASLICRFLEPGPGGALPPDALRVAGDFAASGDVLCAGCGWGGAASPELLKDVLAFPGPVVLDADALNLLARHPVLWNRRSDAVLTPHPGEAARLADAFGVTCEPSREEFAAALAEKLGATVVLKGFRTCVVSPDGRMTVNGSGGPELAVAGSGDVLAGIIAALASGGLPPAEAARLGVFLHGRAGDEGGGGVIADELPRLAARCREELHRW